MAMDKRAIGEQISDEIMRVQVMAAAKRYKVTLGRIMTRIADSLDATDTKASYDKDRNKWVYSAPMVDWGARAKAIDQAVAILDLKPPERKSVEVDLGKDIPQQVKEIVQGIVAYAHPE